MSECTVSDVYLKEDTVIQYPCEFENRKKIYIGNHVRIRKNCWFDVSEDNPKYKWQIIVGDGCAFGQNNQFSTSSRIVFEPFVLTAANVHIATQTHNYQDIETPIMFQGAVDSGPITIGAGCWIGRNALVFADIGKGSVVASNSIVKDPVPDYCVVAGSPAKIIKRYDPETKKWLRCA